MTITPGSSEEWTEHAVTGAMLTCWIEADGQGGSSVLHMIFMADGTGSPEFIAPVVDRTARNLVAQRESTEIALGLDPAHGDRFAATVVDSDSQIVLLISTSRVPEPAVVRVSGPAASKVIELKWDGQGLSRSALTLGVRDEPTAQSLENKRYQIIDAAAEVPGHWLLDEGSLDQYERGRARRKSEKTQKAAANKAKQQRSDRRDTHFINPYTFVVLPGQPPERSAPPGHRRCDDDRPLVRIEVTWQALTPLATRAAHREGGRSGLAGSSVKGAIRTLHEALTGSCLRVVGLDEVPVHREVLPAGRGRTLARVVTVAPPDQDTGHRRVKLKLAEEVVWVDSKHLVALQPPVTGEPYDLTTLKGQVVETLGRLQFEANEGGAAAFVAEGSDWVPMVSHAGARHLKRGYHIAFGRFRREAGTVIKLDSDSDVWRNYERAAEGSDDVRNRRHNQKVDPVVTWARREVGRRQVIRAKLDGDDPIGPGYLFWANVNVKGDSVTGLTAAYVWRRPGAHSLGARLPGGRDSGFQPCGDPGSLCPSCQVFGAAGDDGGAGETGGAGYRGHVRFGPMLTERAPTTEELAPLGSPRPGAGQFYLAGPSGGTTPDRDTIPLREWGSEHDNSTPRQIRGRKFFWPADPVEQQKSRTWPLPRWRKEQAPYGSPEQWAGSATLWPTGTRFTQTITIAGLDRAALGGLLCALSPESLGNAGGLDWGRSVVRMGLGKPFGLGVLRAERLDVSLQTPKQRYGPDVALARVLSDVELDEYARAFIGVVGEPVQQTWPDLRAVLDPAHAWAEYVTYPVDSWDAYPTEGRPEQRRDPYKFEFWKQSVGDDRHRLVALPAARDDDQTLPLCPKNAE